MKTLLLCALAAVPLHAAVIPVDLPPPDPNDTGVKNKPVNIGIQSGQSNSLGFGAIEGAEPFYSMIFLSADPAIVEGILPGENTAIFRFGVFQSDKPDAPATPRKSNSKKPSATRSKSPSSKANRPACEWKRSTSRASDTSASSSTNSAASPT